MAFFIGYLGGWRDLARHYPADAPFSGKKFHLQSARLKRWTNYNNALSVGADPHGLYLAQLFFFRIGHPPLFIPWADITVSEKNGRFWKGYELRFSRCPGIPLVLHARLWDKLLIARQENAPIVP